MEKRGDFVVGKSRADNDMTKKGEAISKDSFEVVDSNKAKENPKKYIMLKPNGDNTEIDMITFGNVDGVKRINFVD